MKKLLLTSFALFLASCNVSDNNSTTNIENEILGPSLSITGNRANGSIDITWTNALNTWTRYRLCVEENAAPDNCRIIKTGSTAGGIVSLKPDSNDVGIEDLLKSPLSFQFLTANGALTRSLPVELVKENLDATIQYLKASTPNTSTGASGGDRFGISTAISQDGKTIAVGSLTAASTANDADPSDRVAGSGAVYVFENTATGWKETAFLKHSFPAIDDNFGMNIAMDAYATTIAIAIPGDDAVGTGVGADPSIKGMDTNTGAIYLYKKDADNWVRDSFIKAEAARANFGDKIALSANGNTLAVSHTSVIKTVDVYQRVSGSWLAYDQIAITETKNITSLALDNTGARLVIGIEENSSGFPDADKVDDTSAPNSGIAYVYTRNDGTGDYKASAVIKAPTITAQARFGNALDISKDGSILAIGAKGSRMAHIFDLKNNLWVQRYTLTETSLLNNDAFADYLSLSDDGTRLVVANTLDDLFNTGIYPADLDNNLRATNSGAVYFYQLEKSAARLVSFNKHIEFAGGARLGTDVHISGNGKLMVAGAPFDDSSSTEINGDTTIDPTTGGNTNKGAALIYAL